MSQADCGQTRIDDIEEEANPYDKKCRQPDVGFITARSG